MSAESGIDTFRGKDGFWTGLFGKVAIAVFGTPLGILIFKKIKDGIQYQEYLGIYM
jgi:NAD-dependent SIR2 family protein deacetylase